LWDLAALAPYDQAANYYLPVSTQYNGSYGISVWLDCDTHYENDEQGFYRYANGTGAGITQSYIKDMHNLSNCDLHRQIDASANFNGSNGGYLKMPDTVGQSEVGRKWGADHFIYDPVH